MTQQQYEELSERVQKYQDLSKDIESAEDMMCLLDSLSENDGCIVEIKVTCLRKDCIAKQLEPEEITFRPSEYTVDEGMWREEMRQLLKKHITFTKEYINKL